MEMTFSPKDKNYLQVKVNKLQLKISNRLARNALNKLCADHNQKLVQYTEEGNWSEEQLKSSLNALSIYYSVQEVLGGI